LNAAPRAGFEGETMNVESMQFGFETVRWLVVTAIGIYAWFIGRQSASAQELLELRTRIVKMEAELKHVPKREDFHVLAIQVERMDVALETIGSRLDSLNATVLRMDDWLRAKAAGR